MSDSREIILVEQTLGEIVRGKVGVRNKASQFKDATEVSLSDFFNNASCTHPDTGRSHSNHLIYIESPTIYFSPYGKKKIEDGVLFNIDHISFALEADTDSFQGDPDKRDDYNRKLTVGQVIPVEARFLFLYGLEMEGTVNRGQGKNQFYTCYDASLIGRVFPNIKTEASDIFNQFGANPKVYSINSKLARRIE